MDAIYQAEHLSKRYGRRQALRDVSFAIRPGCFVGLLGPNGSGKSTLLKCTVGLLRPTGGRVLVGGNAPGPAAKAVTSYLADHPVLPGDWRVSDAVALYRDFYADFDEGKARAMLNDLGLSPRCRVSEMSKGTQEKLQLCLVMSRAARLYLLDEPLGGVDPAARDYILTTILQNYSEDAAVVLSTHLIGDVERALDEAIFLKDGGVLLHQSVDALREEQGKSVDEYFREVFKCSL